MATIGYGLCLLISICAVIWVAQKNYANIDVYYWTILILDPLIILGYWLKTRTAVPEASSVTLCFIYLDSTVLLTVVIFSMLRSIGITAKPVIKVLAYVAAFMHMGLIWFTFDNQLYYESITMVETPMGYATEMVSGPLKILHYIYLAIVLLVLAFIIVLGRIRKGTFSRHSIHGYSVMIGIGAVLYVGEMLLGARFTALPYLYAVASCLIAINYDDFHAHDMSGLISQHYDASQEHGYMAVGLNKTLLCKNEKCIDYLPCLKEHRIDEVLNETDEHTKAILQLIDEYEHGGMNTVEIPSGNRILKCEIAYFSVRKDGKHQGYLLNIYDATEEKHNLEILSDYNSKLNREVTEKTDHIKSIQRSIVLGMADMIENRDNNTGGHVKRTSDIISIIVDEIKKQGKIPVSDRLATDIVRAAPMHDIGKIHIDSSILCKPGRLTKEEFDIMKTHSTKSGEMVMILLDGVEEEHFVKTAYHVARYHHERWDGSGYPEGLVGEMIPLEARIMAIADVYDALVSKRCYKESLSFEQADAIMRENMGTQFDPNMRQVFLGCREQLEEYYRNANLD